MNYSELKEFGEVLESVYGAKVSEYDNGTFLASLSGSADDVYNTLLEIQDLSSRFDFGSGFSQQLTTAANEAGELAENYRSMYNQYVLNEKILPDSSSRFVYNDLMASYTEYQNQNIRS